MRLLSAIKGLFCKEYFIDQNSEATDPYLCGRMDIIEVYGAVGDGVTDDTAAFVAMAEAQDNIELPSDRVFLIGAITITKPRFAISGAGGMGRIKAKAGTNADLITFDGTGSGGGYFRVNHIEIDGNESNNSSGTGLVFKNASYTWCKDIYVHDCKDDGIQIVNHNASVDADEINLLDFRCFSNGRHGVYIHATGSPTQGPGDHLITGGHINYNGGCGIKAEGLIATIIQNNNVLTNSSHGIYLDWTMRNTVSNNACRNNGGCGIFLDSSLGNWSHDNIVIGNQCHYNNSTNSGSCNLNVWNQTRPVIVGNYCGDSGFTNRSQYGAQFYQCIDARICGNNFNNTGNVSGGVFINTGGTGVTYVSTNNIGLADYPTASATVTGPLSNVDWQTFNSKEGDLGSPPVSGRILSSTLSGIRSWIEANAHTHTSAAITDGITFRLTLQSFSGTPVTPPELMSVGEDDASLTVWVQDLAYWDWIELTWTHGVLTLFRCRAASSGTIYSYPA